MKPIEFEPIKLTLYDPETNEVDKTFTKTFLPWGILKQKKRLGSVSANSDVNEEILDSLGRLVVTFFGDQFSLDELNFGADIGEIFSVVQSINKRISQYSPVVRENNTLAFTLYNPKTNEEIKTYIRSFIPWNILKRATKMKVSIGANAEMTEEDQDGIASLVVAIFGDQFSIEDINIGADIGNVLDVVSAVTARASQFVEGHTPTSGNPTPAA